ncbi:MAG: NAD-dependent epimerase/dehydratase family protein, partial [Bacteroidetes bacterium]|nr:NAD-dependent epimerase/dehydratase family protein [Bacteroidota bacterium]
KLDVESIQGDILDPASLDKLVKGTEVVFHLAARINLHGDKQTMYRTHVNGTGNIILASEKHNVRRLIHFSTIHAIDHSNTVKPLDENRPLISESRIMYELSKAHGEGLIRKHQNRIPETIIMNPTAIIGPHDYEPSLQGHFLLQLKNRTLPALVPGGYNWVDVRDVTAAAVKAIDHGESGDRFILSGYWHDFREISEMVEEITGVRTPKTEMPLLLAWIGLPFIQAWALIRNEKPLYNKDTLRVVSSGSKNIDNSKARKILGFNPRPVKESVKDTLNWLEENKK